MGYYLFLIISTLLLLYALKRLIANPKRTIKFRNKIIFKLIRGINSYRRYIYSSGSLRRSLVVLVGISIWYLAIIPYHINFIDNIAYSLIAAFIFDTCLNYEKDHIAKVLISSKWHSDIYSSFDRYRAICELLGLDRNKPNSKTLTDYFFSLFVHPRTDIAADKEHRLYWPFDSNGCSIIDIKEGESIRPTFLRFIKDDAEFINSFYKEANTMLAFPTTSKEARAFNNICVRLYNNISGDTNEYSTAELYKSQIQEYLNQRFIFFNHVESVMGHYGH
ncbi:hypothetical protein P7V44_02665 [Providencia sp. CRE-3FA-0001]|uniref:Uncharacterized protein n=1 Tax=Providencia huashanensis TaxID=3037798 RepID=A0AA42FL35_9GAMM|nr:hypothetical protein [Providencia sp. CRE-3FA-0001]EMB8478214.1 hypothetical protein [Providencia rettgeri]MDG4695138.1 hypothetical protein [Providencia sp. CRE-3FA-0001]